MRLKLGFMISFFCWWFSNLCFCRGFVSQFFLSPVFEQRRVCLVFGGFCSFHRLVCPHWLCRWCLFYIFFSMFEVQSFCDEGFLLEPEFVWGLHVFCRRGYGFVDVGISKLTLLRPAISTPARHVQLNFATFSLLCWCINDGSYFQKLYFILHVIFSFLLFCKLHYQ